MLLVLTGAVKPAASCGNVTIRDEAERLKQYIESIQFFIESGAFTKIVFCDNSNFGTEKLESLQNEAQKHCVLLELLSFQGNAEQTAIHGKGYGEGEIMDHVFANSKLLSGEQSFMKITGRMKVDNIKAIISRLKVEKTYFNIPNRTHREMYDTRMYVMPVKAFRTLFINQYDKVMDDEGIYLEKVYTSVIQENHIHIDNFPRYPRIVGVSGSTGVQYVYTEWKCKIRDVLSQFNFYKVGREYR